MKGKNFIVGETLSMADIYCVSILENFFRFAIEPKQRKQLKNLTKYIETMVNECMKGKMQKLVLGNAAFKKFKLAEKKVVKKVEKKKKEIKVVV